MAPRKKKEVLPSQNQTPVDGTQENLVDEIILIIHQALQIARENTNANTVNTLTRSLAALKAAQSDSGSKRTRKSKEMISAKVIDFIEKEILGIE